MSVEILRGNSERTPTLGLPRHTAVTPVTVLADSNRHNRCDAHLARPFLLFSCPAMADSGTSAYNKNPTGKNQYPPCRMLLDAARHMIMDALLQLALIIRSW